MELIDLTKTLLFTVESVKETKSRVIVELDCDQTNDKLTLHIVHRDCAARTDPFKAVPSDFRVGAQFVLQKNG